MILRLKKHYGVLLLALCVGAVTFFPQLFAIHMMGESFRGVYPINGSDDLYYLARGQEIIDGHKKLGNPYLLEGKDSTISGFWLPDYLVGKFSYSIGLSIPEGFIFLDFFLPLILVLLTYSIGYTLTKNIPLSLATATILHGVLFIDDFSRLPSPQLNFIFWLVACLALLHLTKHRSNKWMIGLAIALGALFYIYPYYWTFYVVTVALFAMSVYFSGGRVLIEKLLLASLGAVFIAIPALVQMFVTANNPFYAETMSRIGLIETHTPSGISVLLWAGATLILLILCIYMKKRAPSHLELLLGSGLLAAVIVTNQHLITGANIEFSSHYLPLTMFWSIFTLTYIFSVWIQSRPNNGVKYSASILGVCVLLALIVASALIEKRSVPGEREVAWQRYAPVFEWLRENTDKESVVYTHEELSNLVAGYTQNNVYYAGWANVHMLSDEEVQKRFWGINYFEDVSEDFVYKNERLIWRVRFIDRHAHIQTENKIRTLLRLDLKEAERIPQKDIDVALDRGEEVQSQSFEAVLRRYQTDYVIWDTMNEIKRPYDDLSYLRKVATIEKFFVYEIL